MQFLWTGAYSLASLAFRLTGATKSRSPNRSRLPARKKGQRAAFNNLCGLGEDLQPLMHGVFFRQQTHSLLRSFLLQVRQKRGRSLTRRVIGTDLLLSNRSPLNPRAMLLRSWQPLFPSLQCRAFSQQPRRKSRSNHVGKMNQPASSNDPAAEDRPNLPT